MGSYRYGFNGQEHSSEIGDNNYTAQFWEYDSRIGRRWNIDAVYKHSPYETFASNPISYADPSGLDTFNFNRRVTTFYPSDGGRPTGTSTFDITQVRSGGADVFMYNRTNTVIDSRGGRTTTTHTVLHPENRESANGMTSGLNLYFDGLVTTERSNYDWESIGKLMYADAGFRKEMLSRNPKSADWMSNASSIQDMEGVMPTAVSSGVGVWVGGIGTLNSAKTLSNFGTDALTFEAAENLVSKRGWYDVVIHGDKSGLAFTRGTNNLVTVQQLYQEMLAAGYQQGTKIRLMSCYAGKLNIGTAAQLSKLAGAPVAAPTGSLWIWRLGDPDAAINYGTQFQIFSNDVHEVGKMLLFKR